MWSLQCPCHVLPSHGKHARHFNCYNLLIYLDDILLYATSIEEMITNLEIVLTRLEEQGLKLIPSKCHLFKRKINYLHIVSEDGESCDPEAIDR